MNVELINLYEAVVEHFGGSQTKTAHALGVAQSSVWAWLNGKAVMSFDVAMRTEKATSGAFLAIELCPSLKAIHDQLTA